MTRWGNAAIVGAAALAALATSSAASADVKAGVDAWSRGDYAAAVHEWQGPAMTGDPDAMFNLAQAYRLGRGVPMDAVKAEALYAQAAAKGHLQAADTYGLMLFQDGRREAALPYIEDAARRGDPRSEYLLGIASFNGDIVPKDWVKAYALLSMANAQGLPQAAAALAQMDKNVPLLQRQQAAGLAVQMQQQADVARGRELAAADLGAGVSSGPQARRPVSPAVASSASRPVTKVAVSPSLAAALSALAQAREATGTESPAEAGASYARHAATPPVQLAVAAPAPKAKVPVAAPTTAPKAPVAIPTAVPKAPVAIATAAPRRAVAASAAPSSGLWRVQLGAFSVRGNADKMWSQVSGRSELAGKTRLAISAGAVTKLQAGGFASRDDAEAACRSLQHSGHDCLVTR
ncbi:MAG: SPOR domain-containing protein [Croceibacterium sp.]